MTVREYDEPPEVLARTAGVGAQVLASSTAFFFLSFLFAYLYLRELDVGGQWRAKGLDAPVALGGVFAALVVASAVAVWLARAEDARRLGLGAGLALGAAALGVQVLEWTTMGFGPNDGAYASVFFGWTAFYFLFVLISLIWVEVELATAIRSPGGDPATLRAVSFYFAFLAGIGVVTWIVLFLV
jgi:heme/copper-type cytochrome/quinol oxidase subunit 3